MTFLLILCFAFALFKTKKCTKYLHIFYNSTKISIFIFSPHIKCLYFTFFYLGYVYILSGTGGVAENQGLEQKLKHLVTWKWLKIGTINKNDIAYDLTRRKWKLNIYINLWQLMGIKNSCGSLACVSVTWELNLTRMKKIKT